MWSGRTDRIGGKKIVMNYFSIFSIPSFFSVLVGNPVGVSD